MFIRTAQGLSNEYLFYNVDAMVYCEGKPSDLYGSTLDELFWTRVLCNNGINCKCKSIGSKNDLLKISEKIVNGDISKVIVAFDRDYDNFTGKLIDHPNILYTYGYSWESDATNEFNFEQALGLFATIADSKTLEQKFIEFTQRQRKRIVRICALDIKYYNCPTALFDRQKPQSIVLDHKSLEPEINRKKILDNAKSIGRFQDTSITKTKYQKICGMTDFFGKSIAKLVYLWFVHYTKKIVRSRKIPYDTFLNNLICTMNITDPALKRNAHYSAVASRYSA